MMYQTTIKGDKRFHSLSEGYGAPVELFGYTEDGKHLWACEYWLASCVTMSTELFCQVSGAEELAIQVDSNYEEGYFTLAIHLPEDLIWKMNRNSWLLWIIIVEWSAFREDIKVDIS